jgi:hypothetical protein
MPESAAREFPQHSRHDPIAMAKDQYKIKEPEELIKSVATIFEKWEGLLAGVDRADTEAVIGLIQAELYGNIDASTYAMD